jgi:hypothetical protein
MPSGEQTGSSAGWLQRAKGLVECLTNRKTEKLDGPGANQASEKLRSEKLTPPKGVPQGLKPRILKGLYGTAEAVPLQNIACTEFFRGQ